MHFVFLKLTIALINKLSGCLGAYFKQVEPLSALTGPSSPRNWPTTRQ